MIEKKICKQLERAYAVNVLHFDQKPFLVYASEATVGAPGYAYAFPLDTFHEMETIWDTVGGCMQIIDHPFLENCFLAVQEFYLKQDPSKARIVIGRRNKKNDYEMHTLFDLPLVHRFGIIRDENDFFLIACTVAKQKDDKDDWTKPGEVWAAKLPSDFEQTAKPTLLKSGFYRNHGFFQDGNEIYIGADEGAFQIKRENGEFTFKQLTSAMTGEVCLQDIDEDGKKELLTIEPFHGNSINLYHLGENDTYEKIFTHTDGVLFAHALSPYEFGEKKGFAIGIRKGKGQILTMEYQDGITLREIDHDAGSANLCCFNHQGMQYIASANHTSNECVVYRIK